MMSSGIEIRSRSRGPWWRLGRPRILMRVSSDSLAGCDFGLVNLQGAELRGANLAGANLAGTNLLRADLRDAKLRGADMRGAYLLAADLRGADLEGADLSGAMYDEDTRWSDDFDPKARGARLVTFY